MPEKLPNYRRDGDIAWYEIHLPTFEGKTFSELVGDFIRYYGFVQVLDIGAGEFVFAEECHKREGWQGHIQVTGVSLHNFLTPEKLSYLQNLGIETHFIPAIDISHHLPPKFNLAVSVLTNIYDTADYVSIMWDALSEGGIGLLDYLPGLRPTSSYQEIQQKLNHIEYHTELYYRHDELITPPQPNSSPPKVKPANNQQDREMYYRLYLETSRSSTNQESSSQPVNFDQIGLSFQKMSDLPNLGPFLQEVIRQTNANPHP